MPRILIIDDDPTTRLGAELILTALGHAAETAENGQQGLAALRERTPDLVVCDVVMPGLDGFEVLAAAQRDPALARIPFIFLTSRSDREDQRRGMVLGADDYLTKPFQPLELVEAIQTRLRKAAAAGPVPGALEEVLERLRGVFDGSEEAPRPQAGPQASAPRRAARAEYWIRRLRALFDEQNPESIPYLEDEVRAKKLTIHGAYLLAVQYLRSGDRSRAEAEFAIAEHVLRSNTERFRQAILASARSVGPAPYPGLRSRILRLERQLDDLRRGALA